MVPAPTCTAMPSAGSATNISCARNRRRRQRRASLACATARAAVTSAALARAMRSDFDHAVIRILFNRCGGQQLREVQPQLTELPPCALTSHGEV